jgi:hypothetical protein
LADGEALRSALRMTGTRTERLTLWPPRGDDRDALWAIHSDPETNRFNPAGPMRTQAEAATMPERLASALPVSRAPCAVARWGAR